MNAQVILMPQDIAHLILDPLASIISPALYNRYYPAIDFFIYLILFTGVARVTLEKRFEGVPGRLLSLGVGIVLAAGLALTEYRMHFNITTFGPLAAIIALTLFGLMFFQILLSFGIPFHVSASFAFISLYTTMRAFAPAIFDWMIVSSPFMAAILSLALLVSFGILVYAIIPKVSGAAASSTPPLRFVPEAVPQMRESAVYSEKAEGFSQRIQLDEQDTFRRLRQVKQYLPNLIRSEEGRSQLLQALREINFREHNVYEKLQQLQALDQAIQKGDLTVFQKISQEIRAGNIPPETLAKVVKILQEVRNRIELEKSINVLQEKLNGLLVRFSGALQALTQAVTDRDGAQAQRTVNAALGVEQDLKKIMDVINVLEKKLKYSFTQALKQAGVGQGKKDADSSRPSSSGRSPK